MKKSTLLALLFLCSLLFIFLAQKINLPAADLGRHIKNGEIFLHAGEYGVSRTALLHTNFFSYTYPDFPFINHHWGSGIGMYLVFLLFGWIGLSLAYIVIMLGAFTLLFLLTKDKTPLYASIPLSIFLIPLIAERVEVRPEVLSYFFIALWIYILTRFSENKLPKKFLYALPLITILWVNSHIYAIFSPLIIGTFICQALIHRDGEKVKALLALFGLSSLALLVSPYGLSGALYPFMIFNNYGYLVAENQSIPFLQKLNFINPNFLWWKLGAGVALLGSLWALKKNMCAFPIALGLMTFAFGGLSFFGIRNLTLFGFILLPFLSVLLGIFFKEIDASNEKREVAWAWSLIISLLLLIFVCVRFSNKLPGTPRWGLGLLPGNISSVTFVKETGIQGPFFSNYDIGGMLIYSLYTPLRKEKVFVDNRPEAYPKEFFSDTYIPMQENTELWTKKAQEYNFNAVWFYRLDSTPWAQNFLISLIKNTQWAPVFVDNYTIIFLKRTPQNEELIKKFELPQSMFTTR
ncbi:MAG: hypothetical protein NTV02_00500 [Candidatus Zambryskibacteria bacterium]|nr:hypothetical protein [Candidatus Zambryskibacteria bacterium]